MGIKHLQETEKLFSKSKELMTKSEIRKNLGHCFQTIEENLAYLLKQKKIKCVNKDGKEKYCKCPNT